MDSRCCVLECDGPGHLDARAKSEPGLALVVVRSYSAKIRAGELGTDAIVNFRGAVAAADAGFGAGLYVVSDRALNYVASMLDGRRPALVVMEGVEYLRLPNCPDLGAQTVWMTRFSSRRIAHRGWASACFSEAMSNDAVVRRRTARRPPIAPSRELYFDALADDSAAVAAALDGGDPGLAIRAFPGHFETGAGRLSPSVDDVCPICYETPSPRVTSACCSRDFCLSCAARSMRLSPSCPWCRRTTGLADFSLEPGHAPAPLKHDLVADLVRGFLAEGPAARVLVVTTDDLYTFSMVTNPLAGFGARGVGGSAACVAAAVRALGGEADGPRVGVARADHMLCCGLAFPPVTHVVFTEQAAWEGDRARCWLAACPNAVRAVTMASVVDAAGAIKISM